MLEENGLQLIREIVAEGRVLWRHHTLERLLERGISRAEVLGALTAGEIIEAYSDDSPFPSFLILLAAASPLHVLVAVDAAMRTCHLITVYRPDLEHFEPDLKTRRKK